MITTRILNLILFLFNSHQTYGANEFILFTFGFLVFPNVILMWGTTWATAAIVHAFDLSNGTYSKILAN